MNKPTKYIFVTGGVISGLGKGITAASIANLLKSRGLRVNLQKCDPYLNMDAGLLNPREHGECFVTFDGAETDLDLGHYERFIDQELNNKSSLMAGKVLYNLIQDERAGKFDGDDVQIIPHLTNAIQQYIADASKGFDVHIVEIGGTVGDYESLSFFEAIREFGIKYGLENCLYIHVVYLPFINTSKEIKTKPAQNSLRDLRGLGIQPNILVCRSENGFNNYRIIQKISLFAGVPNERIAILPNAKSIYEIPLLLEKFGIAEQVVKLLKLKATKPNLKKWQKMVDLANKKFDQKINVAIIAKYLDNADTYISVFEALKSAALWNNVNIEITWVDASEIESGKYDLNDLKKFNGMLVPGGFGTSALEGKIKAAQYALKNNMPYLGLCLGLQMGVIAAARNKGLTKATSFEIDPGSKEQIIITMKDQKGKEQTGGTMRLGNYFCKILPGTITKKLYDKDLIVERHRHRGECNPKYTKFFEQWGIRISGLNPESKLVEIIEGIDHKFFIGTQFHPEFKSRPTLPHPLFTGFIQSMKS